MTVTEYISKQLPERQKVLNEVHGVIIETDQYVKAEVEPMMGKEMIVYKTPRIFKYGLSSVKNHMSLHVMPIYGSPMMYAKYKILLKTAKFQKGCINFTREADMPLNILKQLIHDCSKIDLEKIREEYIKSKKTAQG